jgi:hypothetical protein
MGLRRPRCGAGRVPDPREWSRAAPAARSYVDALDRGEAADGLAAAMQAASREITIMLAPALGAASASPKAA